MTKADRANKEQAKLISKLIRTEYDKFRDTTVMLMEERLKMYEDFLQRHPELKSRPKALQKAIRGLRLSVQYLKREVRSLVPEFRDKFVEEALEKEFKLMTIAGRVTLGHGKKK